MDGHNAIRISTGEIITNDPSLRAYNFTKLRDAFDSDLNVKEQLIELAKQNVPFDSLSPQDYKDILKVLDSYIDTQINEQIAIYERNGVITKEEVTVNMLPAGFKTAGLTTEEINQARKTEKREIYTSEFIPNRIKKDLK